MHKTHGLSSPLRYCGNVTPGGMKTSYTHKKSKCIDKANTPSVESKEKKELSLNDKFEPTNLAAPTSGLLVSWDHSTCLVLEADKSATLSPAYRNILTSLSSAEDNSWEERTLWIVQRRVNTLNGMEWNGKIRELTQTQTLPKPTTEEHLETCVCGLGKVQRILGVRGRCQLAFFFFLSAQSPGSHIAQAGFRLTVVSRATLNSQSSLFWLMLYQFGTN